MRKKSPWKAILITVLVLAVLGSGGFFGFRYFRSRNTEPVYVYDFNMVGMTEYWGDSKQSYGPVTSDKIQTVYLSSTQTITQILVAPGDTVKKGDVLMTFDTTLSDLALERQRLAVEKLKLQVQEGYDRLYEINCMVPMVIPETPEPALPENPGTALPGDWQVAQLEDTNDGSSAEMPLICWLRDGTQLSDSLFELLRQEAAELQAKRLAKQEPPVPPATEAPAAPTDASAPSDPTGGTDPDGTNPDGTNPGGTNPGGTNPDGTNPDGTNPGGTNPGGTDPGETDPGDTPSPSDPVPEVRSFHCVFKVTEGNMSLGTTKIWQGMVISLNPEGTAFQISLFDASGVADNSLEESTEPSQPDFDFGSGFTASQIAQMRSEQEKAIKELEFSVKMEEANYKIMQTEVSDGNIYAQFDGGVISVLDEQEARLNNQPIIKVSGGGGFYIVGTVSELDRDSIAIGQEVTVNDWRSGNSYTGTITRVDDYPSQNSGYSGDGNPNVSYYPFTVFVDGDADLMEYNYVDISYGTADSSHGVYLENPFLRKEGGESFVYVRGADDKLEKRVVQTGKSLWGSYTEILSGLTEEDLVAFPYGKHVFEGAPTAEGDWSNLYE